MSSFYVDTNNGDLILVTNQKEKQFFGGGVFVPFEGLVFVLFENKIVTWSMQDIEGRNLVRLPDDLSQMFMQQFRERVANFSKNG